MRPVDFLKNECENLLSVLDQTLRYDYGLEGSREFYEECGQRLKYIQASLELVDPTNAHIVRELAVNLELLSELVCRIERSSLGEYSWPFVEEFKEISKALCTEKRVLKDRVVVRVPNVHVIAEGGLHTYSIYSDANKQLSKRRIFIIEFPRTLKHYVLFHTILGHEMGHAIYNITQIQKELDDIFVENFVKVSPVFKDAPTVVQWLYSEDAPQEVQARLNHLKTVDLIEPEDFFFAYASYDAWLQEFLCDFIGLLMFGPSFLGAVCHLLYSNDPLGRQVNEEHPLTGIRANILLLAAESLGYTEWKFDKSIQPAVDAFWKDVYEKQETDPWFKVISKEAVKVTVDKLQAFLASFPKTLYQAPDPENINHLVHQILDRCPPVGYKFTSEGPQYRHVDFRDIIFAGWIAQSQPGSTIKFSDINRLCEHGIMQQVSIKKMLENPKKPEDNKKAA